MGAAALHPEGAAEALPLVVPLRLPVLRRPAGWALLDEPALRARAVQLLHAQVFAAAAGRGPGQDVRTAPAPAPASAPASALAPTSALQPLLAPALPEAATMQVAHEPAVADRDPPAQPPPLYGSLGSTPIALLALLALMGLMALAPWLIWAPVVGGLALGILLLQTGLLRRWVAIQRDRAASGEVSAQAPQPGQATQAAGEAAGEAAGRALLAHARGHRVPEAPLGQAVRAVQVVQKVQAVRVPMVRMTHGGWLLTAALVLVGVQAAMLIATVQVQRATAVKPAPADRPRAQGQGPEEPVVEDRASGLSLLRPPAPDTSPRAGAADRGRPQEAAP